MFGALGDFVGGSLGGNVNTVPAQRGVKWPTLVFSEGHGILVGPPYASAQSQPPRREMSYSIASSLTLPDTLLVRRHTAGW